MIAEDSELHPLNDSRLKSRHESYTKNAANDPEYIYRLAEAMEDDLELQLIVHEKFYQGDLSFLMHDGQIKIKKMLDDKPEEDEFLILCSRQLGKSFMGLLIALMHLSKLHGKRKPLVRIFCETASQIRDIVQDNMDLILLVAPPDYIKRTKSENRYKIGKGELRLGMISGAHVNGKRGGNATLILTEESGFSPSETFKDALDNVLGAQLLRSEGKLVHITTSSKDELHHIHHVIQPKCDLAGTLCNLTIYDNPQLNDRQIIKAFKKIFDGTTEGWEREYLVRVVRSMMLTVIPEFHENVVKEDDVPAYAHWLTSIDFGGTRDKHGMILGYHDFKRGVDVIIAELLEDINTGTNIILEKTLKSEKEHMPEEPVSHARKVDGAGQLLVDLRMAGFPCSLPSKAAGSFNAGINQMRLAVLNNTLEIHPRCTHLTNAMKYGKLNKKRTDFERHPIFGHLDILAACMYFLRHINHQNPYPANVGRSSQTHFLVEEKDKEKSAVESILNNFGGS